MHCEKSKCLSGREGMNGIMSSFECANAAMHLSATRNYFNPTELKLRFFQGVFMMSYFLWVFYVKDLDKFSAFIKNDVRKSFQ